MNYEVKKTLGLIKGTVVCSVDGDRKVFASGAEAIEALQGNYDVTSISAEGDAVVITLAENKTTLNDMNEEWVKDHVAKFGKEPNPFDGM